MEILQYKISEDGTYVIFKRTYWFNRWQKWRLTQPEYEEDIRKNTPCSVREFESFAAHIGVMCQKVTE